MVTLPKRGKLKDLMQDVEDAINAGGGGGGGGVWGSITGTLSSQTDLQSALDAKANASSIQSDQVEVDFGSTEISSASTTVSAPWVLSSNILVSSIAYIATTDHDPDDAVAEGITCSTGNIVNGVSYDVILSAPNGSWGKYKVNVVGV